MPGLFARLRTLVRANLNYLLDRLEDPERELRRAVAEMDETLARARTALAEAEAGEQLVHAQLEAHLAEGAAHHEAARAALAAGDEVGARQALAREQLLERTNDMLREDRHTAAETREQLAQQVMLLNAQRDELERKLLLLTTRKRAADAGLAMQQSVGDLDAQQRLREQMQRLDEQTLKAEDRRAALAEQLAESERIAAEVAEEDGVEAALERLRNEPRA